MKRPKTGGRGDLEYIVSEVWDGNCYGFDRIANSGVKVAAAIDIGASCGPSAIQILEAWPGCIVHAYEPDDFRFSLLLENAAEYGTRLLPVKAVVVGSNREHVGSDGHWRKDASEVWSYAEAFGAQMIAADTLPSADFMKIDCEGFEWGILEDLAVAGKLPGVIVGEVHFLNCQDAVAEILRPTHDVEFHANGCPWFQFSATRKGLT
jgi:FkbM family methyltransferase